ncbi:hypothetical protein NPIL_270531 [Nephila pilipes]|uniref:Uncharacterized protein n=1 Tax=Nephila pilipes TaxID=299642 RepID=A0A8X6Q045_NEPPI|nr:hypothetical protein NPIL_270531 [Nephila pilipes]
MPFVRAFCEIHFVCNEMLDTDVLTLSDCIRDTEFTHFNWIGLATDEPEELSLLNLQLLRHQTKVGTISSFNNVGLLLLIEYAFICFGKDL